MMRKLAPHRCLTSLFLLAGLTCGIAFAAHHLSGSWVFDVTLDGQGGQAAIQLEEGEGGMLSGNYTGALGQEEIEGKVDGSKVEIWFDSQAGKITFEGEYADGKITGTCTYGQLGAGTFEAVKKDA